VFLAVRNQTINVFNGLRVLILGLDVKALKIVMDLYEVEDQRTCMDKIMKLFGWWRKEIDDRSEKGK
jgi:hypothetical protein